MHFLYDWLGAAKWIAPFSGVNESTFEHMKLLFWPSFLFAIVESFFFRDREDFWSVKLRGTLLGLILIPIVFYAYNGAIGKSPDWINIAIFFLCAAVSFIYEARKLCLPDGVSKSPRLYFAFFLAIAAVFVLFTFVTPPLGIFRDPLTGGYGI